MRTKRIVVGITTAIALAMPTGTSFAQVSDPTGTFMSDNLQLHAVLPEPTPVGARFRDGLMYLSSLAGLSIYDVRDPAAPEEIGTLPLPHFQNEDVDLGGDILLISNDSAESYGLLHIIDISDPTAPALLHTHELGTTAVEAQFFGGPGHTASCILECSFAWVSDSGGMRVIDLRDPTEPVELGTFVSPAGGNIGITHDVQVDENGVAWISGYGGVFGYRITDDYGDGATAAAAAGGTALTDYHAGLFFAGTGDAGHSTYGDPNSPEFAGLGPGATYNDFILHNSLRLDDSNVVYVTEEDYNRAGCRGAGSFETWHLPLEEEDENENGILDPTGEPMEPIDKWETELIEDTAAPAAVCSAHYFDLRQNVIAQGWYEQGLRLLDVSDPTNIRQVGFFFTPNTASWAAYFPPTDPTGRFVYLLDATLGLVVLEYDRPTEGPLAMGGEDDGGGVVVGPGPGDDDQKADGKKNKKKKDKKKCSKKRTKKARKKCKAKRKQQRSPQHEGRGFEPSSEPSSEATEPTVRAPVLASWTTGAPKGMPSRSFGFACRYVL